MAVKNLRFWKNEEQKWEYWVQSRMKWKNDLEDKLGYNKTEAQIYFEFNRNICPMACGPSSNNIIKKN